MMLFSGLGNPGDNMQKQNIMLVFGFWISWLKKGKSFKPGNGQYVFIEDKKMELFL